MVGAQGQRRGLRPGDGELFGAAKAAILRCAVGEYSWLLSRGYPPDGALKLVGDRHDLVARQRDAVRRASCSHTELATRKATERSLADVDELWIDGLNLLITLQEAAVGGVVLRCRDGSLRDLAALRGAYRRIEQTRGLVERVLTHAAAASVRRLGWSIDRPVSHSGELQALIEEIAPPQTVEVQVELDDDPDGSLVRYVSARTGAAVVSSDGWILDRAPAWVNLARTIVEADFPTARLVDLASGG